MILAVRLVLTSLLLYSVYGETGGVTTFVLGLICFRFECEEYIRKKERDLIFKHL